MPDPELKQVSLDPGESKELGPYGDGQGQEVHIDALAFTCESTGKRNSVEKCSQPWVVELRPGASVTFTNLTDDGEPIELRLVAKPCDSRDVVDTRGRGSGGGAAGAAAQSIGVAPHVHVGGEGAAAARANEPAT
jgi:hypothetical protein